MATKERHPIEDATACYRPAVLNKDRKGNFIYSESKMNESDYLNLNNGIWTKLRAECLQRDGYVCQKCKSPKNLVVHHLRYPGIWGEEELTDLITLCADCHDIVHGRKKGE